MTEQEAIEQLSNYKRMLARVSVLENYSMGAGITVSRLNADDQLQELHRRLRGLPSYMYLNKREQQLESTAHAYLTKYPTGTRAQLRAVPNRGADAEDEKLLKELRDKIEKVIAARGYDMRDDIDVVLDRLAEWQDLKDEVNQIDTVLLALERYKPDYARLLRIKYVDNHSVEETCKQLAVVKQTYIRWRLKALKEFQKLSC
jgi:hypothetical protein